MPDFPDAHGVSIFYDVHEPTDPRGVFLLIHGVGEHGGRYGTLVDALVAHGFVVYVPDQRGHGRTGLGQFDGDTSRLGHLGKGGHAAAVDAMWTMLQLARTDHPDLPLVLFGHSWGSFVAQMLVDRHPDAVDALVLSGSALRWPGSLNAGDLNAPFKSPDATGMEWLSRDPAVVQDFIDDPLTTGEPMQKLWGPIEPLRLIGRPRKNLGHDIPTLLMVGRDDTVGGPRSVHLLAKAYRERSGFSDVTTLVYPDARHEIFNEPEQAEVRADLTAWLDAHIPVRTG